MFDIGGDQTFEGNPCKILWAMTEKDWFEKMGEEQDGRKWIHERNVVIATSWLKKKGKREDNS